MGDAVQQFFAVKAKIAAAEQEARREAGAVVAFLLIFYVAETRTTT